MRDILVISEKADLSSTIEKILHEEYQVKKYHSSQPGYEVSHSADLIIFDITSFKQDAAVIFAQFKTHNPLIPSIALTETGNVKVAVQAMQAGATSVLTLPIDDQELLIEVKDAIAAHNGLRHSKAVIQQAIELLQSLGTRSSYQNNVVSHPKAYQASTRYNEDWVLELGELLIHLKQERASFRGIPIDLTPTQFRLLAYLGEARGHIVSFEELYHHLHDIHLNRSSARTALSAHMSYLRSKLDAVGCSEYLINIRGRGYLLDVPEKRITLNSI
jgi:DNA-binding response OmpR family regulator